MHHRRLWEYYVGDTETFKVLLWSESAAVQAATIQHEHSSAADVVTVGVCALAPRRGDLASELVNRAYRALYQSKSAGRNRVTVAGDKR